MTDIVALLEAVSHRYGQRQALSDIHLEIPAGCMVGLVGPDGVGKSTLLGLIAGARRLQQGALTVLGGDMADQGYRNQVSPRIAYMPQGLGGNLYSALTVDENIGFFADLFGLFGASRDRQIQRLLEATGLLRFRDRPAGKLSGGMKQKLGLCCALIHNPDLLILDEPTTGVDPLSRKRFWDLIDRIREQQTGMSVLVATAYMEEAERFDCLVAMDDGQILATGSPRSLLERTGTQTLDQAFTALHPDAASSGAADQEPLPATPPGWDEEGEQVPAIEAHNLTLRFGSFTAVRDVSFAIRKGEIFGFLGSNGCGKTTTMKMLTGLLTPSEGKVALFGAPLDARDLETRRRVGYMSQSFSLYSELTVRQNLILHARLFHLPEPDIEPRIEALASDFGLTEEMGQLAGSLPLGVRQRLSLAVAVVHSPELLILDEPTSGVDPAARDQFWHLLLRLSRRDGVTIFISTHFMNEGERCDRISLMHAGQVLACDSPEALVRDAGVDTLEAAFMQTLAAVDDEPEPDASRAILGDTSEGRRHGLFRWSRMLAYARRETRELLRDPIRMSFAFLGSALLMLILGYGITLDVEDLTFAVLDRDQSPVSRDYVASIAGSRYFVEQPPLHSEAELEQRMRAGKLTLAVEIPPDFGKDLKRGRDTSVAVWIDGAMPFRGETILGYVQGMHYSYLSDLALRTYGVVPTLSLVSIESRYRYNQDFRSLDAMVPAVIPILLIFIPTILMALGIVREKELGSITNLYVTPVTRLEFLLGKQLPYIGFSMISYASLVLMAVYVFGVPLKGALATLTLGALIYVTVTTGLGLVISAFASTQIAALAAAAILTILPTVQFSGLTEPVSSLEGLAYLVGQFWPATWFLQISRGVFTKGLSLADMQTAFLTLAAFIPVLTLLSVGLLKKQGR